VSADDKLAETIAAETFGQTEQPARGMSTLTDLAAADRLAAANADRLRHVPGKGWLHWTGKRWAPGEIEAHRAAKRNAGELLTEATENGDAKTIGSAARQCGEPRIRGVLTLAASDERLSIAADELDADAHLLNAQNGVVDLRDGTLSEHRPELHLSKIAGADYLPDAHSQRWADHLARATGGDVGLIEFMRRGAGYTATGSVAEEVALFAYGPGASAKTTTVEALRAALGSYAVVSDFGTFLASKGDGNGATPGVARLAGARMVCASEVGAGQKFNPARLKTLTGAERIVARGLYQGAVEFDPQFTLWLAANERPAIPADDDAAWRRIRLLPFENVIPADERDPAHKHALTHDPDELAAVLAWIVQGAIEWHTNGLGTCTAVEQATAEYRGANDPLGEWIVACCELADDASTPGRELREHYERWCRQSGEEACSPHEFARALQSHGLARRRGKSGYIWQGIYPTTGVPSAPSAGENGNLPIRARMSDFPETGTPGTPGTPARSNG
jgi:putative DNA primase/helicase